MVQNGTIDGCKYLLAKEAAILMARMKTLEIDQS